MTLEEFIIAAARIAGSLPVLRWALAGAILAILVDFSDTSMITLLQFGGVGTTNRSIRQWTSYTWLPSWSSLSNGPAHPARWQ